MFINDFSDSDIAVVLGLARALTGTMVNSRDHSVILHNVATRIQQLEIESLEKYLLYVDDTPEEYSHLISALTIHTTSWFREANAFKVLRRVCSEFIKQKKQESFKLLSVACSTGEEVYSAAFVLETLRLENANFDYEIEGWDIDPISLRTARFGVYPEKSTLAIPDQYRQFLNNHALVTQSSQHILASESLESTQSGIVVSREIKERVKFKTVNIMSAPKDAHDVHFLFCRNMLIYFDAESVRKIVSYLLKLLKPGGKLCVGLSETSALSDSKVLPLGQAVYEKKTLPLAPAVQPANYESAKIEKAVVSKNILIVEDHEDLREVMVEKLLASNYEVDWAPDAESALKMIVNKSYGLVLSDYSMPPGDNGVNLCKKVRSNGFAGRFVLVTALADRSMAEQALNYGADEVVLKPCVGEDLVRLVRSYFKEAKTLHASDLSFRPELILLGASTGGTEVLARFVEGLPAPTPPIMIVQHIAPGFSQEFGLRLASGAGLTLANIKNDEMLHPGRIYLALGDYHIGVRTDESQRMRLVVSHSDQVSGHRPSVDFMFDSAAKTNLKIFAALFTGMGKDGASGLLSLKNQGAVTLAQNEETSAVFGMPKEAIRLGAASIIGSPQEIRRILIESLAIQDEKSRTLSIA